MQELIICKGLPASGKSYFSKKWVNEDPTKRVRVCRDNIRRMFGPYWIPTREKLVTEIEYNTILSSLLSGYSVIVDATNFRHNFEHLQKDLYGPISITVKDFTDVPIETCIERDKLRIGDEQVGEAVIRRMYDKYLKK